MEIIFMYIRKALDTYEDYVFLCKRCFVTSFKSDLYEYNRVNSFRFP